MSAYRCSSTVYVEGEHGATDVQCDLNEGHEGQHEHGPETYSGTKPEGSRQDGRKPSGNGGICGGTG